MILKSVSGNDKAFYKESSLREKEQIKSMGGNGREGGEDGKRNRGARGKEGREDDINKGGKESKE